MGLNMKKNNVRVNLVTPTAQALRLGWASVAAMTMGFLTIDVTRADTWGFTTVVGNAAALDHTDGTGNNARLFNPTSVAVDATGTIYFADGGDHTVRKVTTGGIVTTIAGSSGQAGSLDGSGSNARFVYPYAVAVDGVGNLFVTDIGDHTVRKVTAGGTVTTIAGSVGVAGSLDGAGAAAQFNYPQGIAVDAGGNVYVGDSNNNTIRKISPGGVVTTLAGVAGLSGIADGTGSAARFNYPSGLAVDGAGNIYVADHGSSSIRKITSGGTVTTLAGSGGVSGNTDGAASAARFDHPAAVAVDAAGNVYVIDTSNQTVRVISGASGNVTTLAGAPGQAGKADGTGAVARFFYPFGITVTGSGTVYVADTGNHTVRVVTSGGAVATLAGAAGISGIADGVGGEALFAYPDGVALDAAGTLYVADHDNQTIRKVTAAGAVTTVAGAAKISGTADGTGGAARFSSPTGVAVDSSGNIYVVDSGNSTIRKIGVGGIVTTFAGVAGVAGSSDGTGGSARFNAPEGIAIDSVGNLFVADTNNSTIRKITAAGAVSTFAGVAGQTGTADGPGGSARFNGPYAVAVDGAGNVYVSDFFNSTIRKITAGGTVTTLAGLAGSPGAADGTGTAARFNQSYGLTVDSIGNVFVADTYNRAIRKVTAGGVVSTLNGTLTRFYYPQGIAVNASGNLFVTDGDNQAISKGVFTVILPTITTQPASQTPAVGGTVTLTTGATIPSGNPALTYQWQFNGTNLSGASGATLTINNTQPADAGLYTAVVTSTGSVTSAPAIVGVTTTTEVVGTGAVQVVHQQHPNGNYYDQVLLTGSAVAIKAPGYVVRTSFIDLNDDIVQVEFSGAGTMSLVLDSPSGPAPALNYNQAVNYMKGHAGIVITGADDTTNILVFTVGRATAFDPTGAFNIVQPISLTNVPANNGSTLFQGHQSTVYAGIADIAFIAISSTNGKFGGLRTSDASYFATKGSTGIYAPGVQFTGPVYAEDINAFTAAGSLLIIGSSPDTRITGGDMSQANGQPVQVSGLTQLKFTAGTMSSGGTLAAQTNKAVFMQNGVDVTAQIVVYPAP